MFKDTRGEVPAYPLWGRGGHVPMHPEPDIGAAAPKPDANQPAVPKVEPVAPAAKVAPPPAPEPAPTPKPESTPMVPVPVVPVAAAKPEDRYEAAVKALDAKAAAVDAKLEKQRQRAIVSTLRKMGADPDLVSDDDLLTLAPKVDPDEPAGLAELVKWKGTKGFFRRAEVGPQENLGELVKAAQEDESMPAHLRARKARMLQKLHGGA